MENINEKKMIDLSINKTAHKTKNKETKVSKMSILSISSIPLVMTLGNSMLIPVLPSIEKKLNISSFQVSMIITVYSILAILLIPVAGYLSDHIGRKKVIIPSLIISGIGGSIAGIAAWLIKDSYWIILLGRALQGIGAAGAFPIVLPLVGDMFKKEEEVSSTLGVIETANTFGKVLSPILGAILAGFIWFIPFMSIPIFCLLSVLLILIFVKVPASDKKPLPFKQFITHTKEVIHKDKKWLYAIFFIGTIVMFVLFAEMFYLSDVLEKKYHIKNIKKGVFLAIPLGALCITSFITEGAIPFAAADPLRVIPSVVVGAAITGGLSMFFNIGLRAPHGGVFVIGLVDGSWLLYLLSIVIGSVVGAILLGVLKKPAAQK